MLIVMKQKLKDYKYLSMAIEYETNPTILDSDKGSGLMASRINTFKDSSNVIGPLNAKGKKIKIIDMSNPESAGHQMIKAQNRVDQIIQDFKDNGDYDDLTDVIEEVFGETDGKVGSESDLFSKGLASTMNNSNGKFDSPIKFDSTGLKLKIAQGSRLEMSELELAEQELNDVLITTMPAIKEEMKFSLRDLNT